MSIIIIITILIIVGFVAGVGYYLYKDHKKDVKDITEIQQHRAKKEALLLDYYRVVERGVSEYNPQYFRKVKSWTDAEESQIYERGYMEAEKWMDDLRYAGIKVYVRLHHFYLPPEPSKITSSVLYNVYSSRSVSKFINGITKINFATMDLKTLMIIIPIVVGLGLGMVYFLGMK